MNILPEMHLDKDENLLNFGCCELQGRDRPRNFFWSIALRDGHTSTISFMSMEKLIKSSLKFYHVYLWTRMFSLKEVWIWNSDPVYPDTTPDMDSMWTVDGFCIARGLLSECSNCTSGELNWVWFNMHRVRVPSNSNNIKNILDPVIGQVIMHKSARKVQASAFSSSFSTYMYTSPVALS